MSPHFIGLADTEYGNIVARWRDRPRSRVVFHPTGTIQITYENDEDYDWRMKTLLPCLVPRQGEKLVLEEKTRVDLYDKKVEIYNYYRDGHEIQCVDGRIVHSSLCLVCLAPDMLSHFQDDSPLWPSRLLGTHAFCDAHLQNDKTSVGGFYLQEMLEPLRWMPFGTRGAYETFFDAAASSLAERAKRKRRT